MRVAYVWRPCLYYKRLQVLKRVCFKLKPVFSRQRILLLKKLKCMLCATWYNRTLFWSPIANVQHIPSVFCKNWLSFHKMYQRLFNKNIYANTWSLITYFRLILNYLVFIAAIMNWAKFAKLPIHKMSQNILFHLVSICSIPARHINVYNIYIYRSDSLKQPRIQHNLSELYSQ